MNNHFRFEAIQNFSNFSKNLTKEFSTVMKNPWDESRFQWDYFYIPDQYRLMRTWADQFFSEKLWSELESELTEFGKTYLGCQGITRPWLSFYTDGSYQNIHADVPHGPFAFVFSLTDWKNKKFKGGETILFKDTVLDYWNHYENLKGVETSDLFEKIPSVQNQLLVFDPRIPHGVERVTGVENPIDSRIVVHGWFTNPEPTVEGPLASKQLIQEINRIISSQEELFEEYKNLKGYLCLKIILGSKKTETSLVISTLRGYSNKEIESFQKALFECFQRHKWPLLKEKTSEKTIVTLPLMFQSH